MESDSGSILSQLILILILTLINAFFASAEMAMVSANKNKIKKLSEEGNKNARLLTKLMDDPSNFLSTIQIGITLAGFFSSASAATGISDDLALFLVQFNIPYPQKVSLIGVTILLSYFTLVFGELVPKRVALKKAESIALFSVKPIYLVSIVAKPFIKILSTSTAIVFKLLGNNTDEASEKISEEEVRALVHQSEQDGCINDDEKQMIDGVFEFNDTTAKEIMTSRKDTFVIDVNDDIEEILDSLLVLNYSRVPVYEDTIDNIIGILYIKDLLPEARKVGFAHIDLKSILHTPYFVPERKKANELFKLLKESKTHLAVLINEYGGFSGIVTMEDLVEEIVGEIQDEYDKEDADIKKIDDSTFLVKGSSSITQLNSKLYLNLQPGEYDTLNGYLLTQIGEIPKETFTLELNNLQFKVVKIDQRRIEDVQIKLLTA